MDSQYSELNDLELFHSWQRQATILFNGFFRYLRVNIWYTLRLKFPVALLIALIRTHPRGGYLTFRILRKNVLVNQHEITQLSYGRRSTPPSDILKPTSANVRSFLSELCPFYILLIYCKTCHIMSQRCIVFSL